MRNTLAGANPSWLAIWPPPSTLAVVPLSIDAVDQVVVHLGEAVPQPDEELRVVEGVVQQGRELEPEAVLGDDVLVEAEVHDPGAGAEEAALLRVAELAVGGHRVGGHVVERVARPADVRVLDLVRPPRAAEVVAEAVERLERVPRARRVEAREERRQVVAALRLEERRHRPAAEERVRPARHVGAVLAPVADRDVPGAVHHDAVLHHVRVGPLVLRDVVGVEHHDAHACCCRSRGRCRSSGRTCRPR